MQFRGLDSPFVAGFDYNLYFGVVLCDSIDLGLDRRILDVIFQHAV